MLKTQLGTPKGINVLLMIQQQALGKSYEQSPKAGCQPSCKVKNPPFEDISQGLSFWDFGSSKSVTLSTTEINHIQNTTEPCLKENERTQNFLHCVKGRAQNVLSEKMWCLESTFYYATDYLVHQMFGIFFPETWINLTLRSLMYYKLTFVSVSFDSFSNKLAIVLQLRLTLRYNNVLNI